MSDAAIFFLMVALTGLGAWLARWSATKHLDSIEARHKARHTARFGGADFIGAPEIMVHVENRWEMEHLIARDDDWLDGLRTPDGKTVREVAGQSPFIVLFGPNHGWCLPVELGKPA